MRSLFLALAISTAGIAQAPVPEIAFEGNINPLKVPDNIHFGEVAGVALNAQRHVFVYTRTGIRSTVHGQSSAQVFEFGADGAFIKEWGKDLYGFAFAHTIRFDKQGNLWATDEGTNNVIRFNPAGRVTLVLGRREESVEPVREPAPGAPPPRGNWGQFGRPTDVAFDNAGNVYIADGYTNSRVVKVDKNGRWVKTWGERGTGPSQFNILHTIASDKDGNIYVGDRTNRRVQVFDTAGAFLREFKIDVPYTKEVNVLVGANNTPNLANVNGAPWAMCITPGPTQYIYVSDAVPGRIYKTKLDGTVVGVLGDAGKEAKQFGWIHEIACPSENELWVAELLNWRVQKLTLHP
jgi:DNA-binding beta-propeller fold protein YncE